MQNSYRAIFKEGQVLLNKYLETKENKYREYYESWVHATYGSVFMKYSQLFGFIKHLDLTSIVDIGSWQPYQVKLLTRYPKVQYIAIDSSELVDFDRMVELYPKGIYIKGEYPCDIPEYERVMRVGVSLFCLGTLYAEESVRVVNALVKDFDTIIIVVDDLLLIEWETQFCSKSYYTKVIAECGVNGLPLLFATKYDYLFEKAEGYQYYDPKYALERF